MLKKYLGIISLAAVFAVPSLAAAQSTGTFQAPQIQVDHIVLSQPLVSQGDTVTGTFEMINQGTSAASNIGYRVSLVGNYQKNTLAGTFYDTSVQQGSVFVPGNTSVSVPFTYTLPIAISGTGLGIEIQAYTSAGIPLGWSDDKLTVHAKQGIVLPPTLSIASAALELGTSTFPLQAGPVIHPGETPTLVIGLASAPKTTLPLIAHIDLYNRLIAGTPLTTTTSSVTLTSHTKTFSVALPLPTTARVYDARVTLETTSGVPVAPPLEVRYIVAGDIITIQSLTSDVSSVTAGNPVTLTLQYTGSPFDIRTGAVANQSTSTLSIVLSNELGTTIGTYSALLDPAGGTIQAPITVSANATAMTATATVTNNGKVIATYATNLSPNVAAARAKALNQSSSISSLFLIILSVILLIVILVIYFMLKKKKLPVTPLVVLAVMTVCGLTLFSGAGVARAWTYNPYAVSISVPALKDTNGNLSNTFTPGQTFEFTGNVYVEGCANESPNVDFYFLNPTTAQNYTTTTIYYGYQSNPQPIVINYTSFYNQNYNSGYNGEGGQTYGYQMAYIFTAPTTPGTYSIQLYIDATQYFDGEWGGGSSGPYGVSGGSGNEYNVADVTLTYTVVAPTGAISASQVAPGFNCYIPAGASTCSSTISWSTNNTATSSVVINKSTPQQQTFWSGNGTNGSQVSQAADWIRITPTVFTLEDSTGGSLASVSVVGTCASGTAWDSTSNTCEPPPIGYFDQATCSIVSGWTCDSSNFATPLRVDLYTNAPFGSAGSTFVTSYTADQSRPDVAPVCGSTANHGWSGALPSSLIDGKPHTLYAYGIAPDGTSHTLLTVNSTSNNANDANSSFTVTCSPPSSLSFGLTGPSSVTSGVSFPINWTLTSTTALAPSHPSLWQQVLAFFDLAPTSADAQTSNGSCNVTWTSSSSGISATWNSPSPTVSPWTQGTPVTTTLPGMTGNWNIALTNSGSSAATVTINADCGSLGNGQVPISVQPSSTLPPTTLPPPPPYQATLNVQNDLTGTCGGTITWNTNIPLADFNDGSVSCKLDGANGSTLTISTPNNSVNISGNPHSSTVFTLSCIDNGMSLAKDPTATFSLGTCNQSTSPNGSSGGGQINFFPF